MYSSPQSFFYLDRRFPRALGFLVVLASLNPVVFCCNSWLALVRGRRGEGFPVPGRTGVPARAFWELALRIRMPMQQYKLALKAHILMATPNQRGHTYSLVKGTTGKRIGNVYHTLDSLKVVNGND